MTQSHKDIPDRQRHEPKGISSATSGQVYVAGGSGSGSWKRPAGSEFASMSITNNITADAVTLNTNPHVDSNYVALGPRFTSDIEQGLSIAAGVITIPKAGVYTLSVDMSARHDTANATIYLAHKVSGTLGPRVMQHRTFAAAEYVNLSHSIEISASASDTVAIFFGSDVTGNVTVNDASVSLVLLRDDT